MRVLVSLEHRFDRTPDGMVWTSATFAYPFWLRYLDVFDTVRVVARVRDVASVPAQYLQSSGAGVTFTAIPYFRGPAQFLRVARQAQQIAQAAVQPTDAVILRIGSLVANLIEPTLVRTKHPFGVEVVGDPYDVFAPGAIQHPLRPFFRWWFVRAQKRQCQRAVGAAYVTKVALQKRYPCLTSWAISDVELRSSRAYQKVETHYSSVELDRCDYSEHSRTFATGIKPLGLIFVGTLEQLYKSPDILIQAFAENVHSGLDLELVIVGDGQYRTSLENLAVKLGVRDRVIFAGMLPRTSVMEQLDRAHLFVLPSRQEGLPRAMLEAMARALPCIGSTVGGIPELLPPEDMVPPNDVYALACKIKEVVSNPQRMTEMSSRNLRVAREYEASVLRARRIEFYQYIRRRTEMWLKEQQI